LGEARFKVNTPAWNRYRLIVAATATVAVIASFTPPAHHLETRLLDWASRFMPAAQAPRSVAVVGIDQATLDTHGNWPWPRERIVAVLERLQRFQPAVIGVVLPLSDAETPPLLESLRADLDSLEPPLRDKAAAWLARLDVDRQLAQSIATAGNLVLSAEASTQATPVMAPRHLERFALAVPLEAPSWRRFALQGLLSPPAPRDTRLQAPLPRLLDAAAGLGVTHRYREGQSVPGVAILTPVLGRYVPGLELALLATMQGTDASKLGFTPGAPLRMGAAGELGGPDLGYYPRPAAVPPAYSLGDVLQDDALAGRLRGKAVLLGLTAPALVPRLRGPAGQPHTPVSWSAQVLGSMLEDNSIALPVWAYGAQRALVILIALYLALLPATWHCLRAPLISGLAAIGLLNAALVTLIVHALWLPVMLPALFIVTVQVLLTLAARRAGLLAGLQQQTTQARLELGRNLQAQGQLDPAMEQFLRCLPASAALEPLYELGLEYERRRQVSRAQTIYARLEATAGDFRDASRRRERLASLSDRFPNGNGSSANRTLILDNPVMELPVLGRYQLQRELGSGAMGTVYLAVDPNIGREVAVKALPLLETPAGAEQEAAAARFFHEAEAVGRLDHPNIVTVHDVGKEHDLAYMAMDYVPGESLDAWTHRSTLLPVWEVLEVAAQVADALAYAHGRKVVHRDIKPSNIIYDRAGGLAKITDFGVARMLDSNRTRTGTILGSPSYMSPEQVAGNKVDGRSDLFSLGTTLYQLLTGSLPFGGDSVANVMYQIANAKTPPLRKARQGLPASVTRLVMRALQKDPGKRFAGGAEMAATIRKCRAQLRGGRRKTA
jgi:CHASE2 domain-containing sensor protein